MTSASPRYKHNAAWARSLLLWPAVFGVVMALAFVLMADATGFEGVPGPLAVYGCGCYLFLYWLFVSLPFSLTGDRHWSRHAVPVITAAMFLALPVAFLGWWATGMVASVVAMFVVEVHLGARQRRSDREQLRADGPDEGPK